MRNLDIKRIPKQKPESFSTAEMIGATYANSMPIVPVPATPQAGLLLAAELQEQELLQPIESLQTAETFTGLPSEQPDLQESVREEIHEQGVVDGYNLIESDQIFVYPKQKKENSYKFRFSKKQVLTPVAFILTALLIFVGTKLVSFANSVSLAHINIFQNISSNVGASLGKTIPVLASLDSTPVAEAIRGKGSVNVLLLGYGGDGHSGGYLTDSIMVLNLNFSTNKVTMVSIPRDTWIKIPTSGNDGSYWKINASYELGLDSKHYPNKLPEFSGPAGGGNLAKHEISQVTGLQIDNFIAMDFNGFKQIVDTLGGVQINVDNSFTDYTYPSSDSKADGPSCIGEDAATNCRYMKVHFDAGLQYMNGERALEYVRSRHSADNGEGSDFARSKRQQKLITAIQKKALSVGAIPKMLQLMDDVKGHLQTDLSIAEIQDLSGYIKSANLDNANHVALTSSNLLVSGRSQDGQYILTPRQGTDNWSEVHQYIFDAINNIQDSTSSSTAPATPSRGAGLHQARTLSGAVGSYHTALYNN